MSKRIELQPGQKFGRLVVIARAANSKNGDTRWICKCSCGETKIFYGGALRSGHTKSCGCLAREKKETHGNSNTRLYRIWCGIKQRCTNPKNKDYPRYGGRGITVCEGWQKFQPFYDWAMSHGYDHTLTLERVDTNGGYSAENCRWITMKEQGLNRRNNRLITAFGETKTLGEWAEKYNIHYVALRLRLERGWSVERALTAPVREQMSHPKKQK